LVTITNITSAGGVPVSVFHAGPHSKKSEEEREEKREEDAFEP
jgi:hypothetical protein